MINEIFVVSLGFSPKEHMTQKGLSALNSGIKVYLQTRQHPGIEYFKGEGIAFETLDNIYDTVEDFDQLNQEIADFLLAQSKQTPIVYGVIDALLDETVACLMKNQKKGQVKIISGLSFENFLGVELLNLNGQKPDKWLSATNYSQNPYWPGESLLLAQLHSKLLAGEIKLWLMNYAKAEEKVVLFNWAQGEWQKKEISLADMDRQNDYNQSTCLYVPAFSFENRQGYHFYDLVKVIKTLRGPNGCPWDREQTHQSLCPYLIEEAYEVIAAIDEDNMDNVYDELGDVMLQVMLHSEIGSEHGEFSIVDVITALCKKMVHRHPHVFAQGEAATSNDVVAKWEQIKQQERGIDSVGVEMQQVPLSFPALLRAEKVQSKARRVGFDWKLPLEALEKVYEEADEVKDELVNGRDPFEELGDLLFACVNVIRIAKGSSETILNRATNKFVKRFTRMEKAIKKEGKALKDLTFCEMDVYWKTEKDN